MTMDEPPSLAVAAGSPKEFSGRSQDSGRLSCSRRTVEEHIGKLKKEEKKRTRRTRKRRKRKRRKRTRRRRTRHLRNVSLYQSIHNLQFCERITKKYYVGMI